MSDNDTSIECDCDNCDNCQDRDRYENFSHWYNCETWDDLRMHMLKFLQGEYHMTPSHFGPLQEKDPLYKEKLIKLNSLGIISDNGQEFEQIKRINKIDMQREYLVFGFKINDQHHLETILDKFQKSDFYFQAYSFNSNLNSNPKYYLSDGLELIDFDNPEFWITRTLDLKTNEYNNYTHLLCYQDMPYILKEYQKILPTLYDNLIIVEIWVATSSTKT